MLQRRSGRDDLLDDGVSPFVAIVLLIICGVVGYVIWQSLPDWWHGV